MKKVLQLVTNKFLITIVVFAVWMTYFDQNDWLALRERKRELQNVKDNIAYLEQEIGRMETEQKQMTTDPKQLEKFAREQFRMKRDNEDVYIVQ